MSSKRWSVSNVTMALGDRVRGRPRMYSAVAFGVATGLVMHWSWIGTAATSGLAPVLTLAAALAHALAGAIMGSRLIDGTRTRSAADAGLIGAFTSLIALAIFAPLFALYLMVTEMRLVGVWSFLVFPLYVALFAFLAAGWALLLVSAGVGGLLYSVAAVPDSPLQSSR
jgi:hypothetical protein